MKEKGVGIEFLKSYFAKDAFAELCGIELIEASDGHAVAVVRIEDKHLNGIGLVHGGLLCTLADLAFAAAAHTRGKVAVSISNTISYIKPAQGMLLRAEAVEVSRNPRLGTYAVNVLDESREVIAAFQGLAYIKNQNLL